jgi:serine/threonine protein kinase
MGQVFRARDTKLGRDVALKVLPDSLAADADRLARFTREAQVLASLNHPHIAQVHGLEDSTGVRALVMELVEGEDLSERIRRGAIPSDEALPIAKQIAEALEAAHERGIVHRDLKPANIKVGGDGTVKVLDFGLAKALDTDPSSATAAHASISPTITSPAMTQAGMILGSAAYMSPEQARGKSVDKRSDIWAFGCVVYEMLTGTRAFAGAEVSDVLASVLATEPDWTRLGGTVPPGLTVILQRCLEKDPKRRVRDIGDVRLALDGAFDVPTPAAADSRSVSPGTSRLPWLMTAAALLALVAFTLVHVREVPPDLPETRLEITTPPGRRSFAKISPDGRKVVFSAAVEGKPSQLWVRAFDAETAQPIPGTEYAGSPFWAPDSRSLGFYAKGKLMRVDLAGGGPRALADSGNSPGGAWGPDGTILFTPTNTGPLYRVPSTGGQPAGVTELRVPDEASHRYPTFLPDGRHFLFFVAGHADATAVYLGSLDSKNTRRVLESDSAAVFVPPQYVLFRQQDTLLARRFDPKTFETTGDSLPVAEQVSGDQGTLGEIAASASHTGVIAYRPLPSYPHQLTWFDRAGRRTGTLGDQDASASGPRGLRISPDGRTVALTRDVQGNIDVWLMDVARGVLRRFTSDAASDGSAVWAPDSARIAFFSRRSGPQNIWVKRLDGVGEVRLRESPENEVPVDWSSDGRFMLMTLGTALAGLPIDSDGTIVRLVSAGTRVVGPARFSPDGQRVAYASGESGRVEVYVLPFPGPGVPIQVSTAGGANPRWRQDGRELFYLSLAGILTAVQVVPKPNGTVEVGAATSLFEMPGGAAFDVARDGQRVLVEAPIGQGTVPPIVVIQNWKPGPAAR